MVKQFKKFNAKEINKINRLKRDIKKGKNVEVNQMKLEVLQNKYNVAI